MPSTEPYVMRRATLNGCNGTQQQICAMKLDSRGRIVRARLISMILGMMALFPMTSRTALWDAARYSSFASPVTGPEIPPGSSLLIVARAGSLGDRQPTDSWPEFGDRCRLARFLFDYW
jgi:hypothetical protein